MKIKNIIFDWSGTLVDDLPAVLKATNHVLAMADRTPLSLDQFRAEFCLPFTIFYDKHVPHIELKQLEEWFHSHFRQVQDSVCELPHARQFLQFCRDRSVRTFLLSTVHPDHYEVQSGVTQLAIFIDKPYVGVWDKRARIKDILEENQLVPEETLFIGDMEHDIETARHGGIHSCAVLTGYNTLEQLRRADPDIIVEHLRELKDLLDLQDMELKPHAEDFEARHQPVVTVGGLIYNDAGDVLLVRTHKWSELWGIPGGKIKWGEPSETALRREIKEETGLEVDDVRFVLVQDCIHSREFYRDAHFVLLNYTCRAKGQQKVTLNDEAREYRWLTPQEASTVAMNTPTLVLLQAVKGS